MKCAECGCTTIRRIYDATVTRYVGPDGKESEQKDVNIMDDDCIEECNECGSYLIEED